jgi:flagellar motor protein MotB
MFAESLQITFFRIMRHIMLVLCLFLAACQGRQQEALQQKIRLLEGKLSQEYETHRRLQRYIDQQLGGSPAELTFEMQDSLATDGGSGDQQQNEWSLSDSTLNATLLALKQALGGKLYMYKKSAGTDMLRLGGDMFFDPGEYILSKKGQNTVAIIGSYLQRHPFLSLEVVGHTDDQPVLGNGPLRDNWDLSALRATSVVRGLVKAGVSPQHVSAVGRGPWQPIDRNDREAGRYLNRRTEIWVKRR